MNSEVIVERSNDPRIKIHASINPTLIDIGWCAGIIDGEGSVTSHPTSHAGVRNGFRICVRVTNTDRRMVDRLSALWGGSTHTSRMNSQFGYKPCYYWAIGSKSALFMLKAVRDALVVKREQATIAIELQERICKRIGYTYGFNKSKRIGCFDGAIITDEEIGVRSRLHGAICKLNTRRIIREDGIKPGLICPGNRIDALRK